MHQIKSGFKGDESIREGIVEAEATLELSFSLAHILLNADLLTFPHPIEILALIIAIESNLNHSVMVRCLKFLLCSHMNKVLSDTEFLCQ
jgi:hypothetical protein